MCLPGAGSEEDVTTKSLMRQSRKEKKDFTTKDTKITKFKKINIRTLRVNRALRGEKVTYRISNGRRQFINHCHY